MNKTITLGQALERLRNGESLQNLVVVLDHTPIEALEAVQLRKQGIDVPDALVYTNYEAIDYSDIPDVEEGETWRGAKEEE